MNEKVNERVSRYPSRRRKRLWSPQVYCRYLCGIRRDRSRPFADQQKNSGSDSEL